MGNMGAAPYAGFLSSFRPYLLARLHRSTGRSDIIPRTRPHALYAHTQHYLPDVHQTNWFHFPFLDPQLCKGRTAITTSSSRISQQCTSLPTLPTHASLPNLFFISALAHTPCCDDIRGGRRPDCMAPWRHLEIG